MLSNSEKNSLVRPLITDSNSAEILGSGGFGNVYKVGSMVVKKMNLIGEEDVKSFQKEVAIWNEFSANPEVAPFIPRFLGSHLKKGNGSPKPANTNMVVDPDKYAKNFKAYLNNKEPDYYGFIIQTFVPVIELSDFISRFNDKTKFYFEGGYALFNNLVKGFDILHKSGYIHRDIKPGNILIRTEGDRTMPIIIDFGMVCKLPCNIENLCQNNIFSPNGTLISLRKRIFILSS